METKSTYENNVFKIIEWGEYIGTAGLGGVYSTKATTSRNMFLFLDNRPTIWFLPQKNWNLWEKITKIADYEYFGSKW